MAERFRLLATEAGYDLLPSQPLPWLTTRGHVAVAAHLPTDVHSALQAIFELLDGDEAALAAKPQRSVAPDFLLEGRIVEFDEDQHFTIQRLATFALYPADAQLAFERSVYAKACLATAKRAERAFAHKTATEFPGPYGRARQRAYFDAVRDLLSPVLGSGPVVRVLAPERDPVLALDRFRQVLA
ncbi:hypothetical protein [Conexibacter sp. SYSU D00693]|uniref:hypothetical protein n=1 Tax=Conexibacter sp. SYSU D00693 TaxID=2812560 RepID=UPI00196A264D|nr:hypothetical protein [Conexibacter sp. SYSU D00693]